MSNDRFKRKIEGDFAYDVSGRYAERHKGQRFRVLVITKTPERLTNLKETTAQVAQRYCWFTTLAEIAQHGPLAAAWEIVGREGKTRLIEVGNTEVHDQP